MVPLTQELTRQPSATMAAAVTAAVKTYGEGDTAVHALNGLSVGFAAGEMTAIMGPSGSGKSTLMQCMAGLDQLTSGEAYVGEIELSTLNERQLTRLRRDQIGFVFQSFNLIPTLTSIENITLPLDLAGAKPNQDWIDHIVTSVGLGDRLTHRPAELSGGQQQRVAVARALATRPQIVFADEPTGNLDSRTGAEILNLMGQAVADMGQTIVMVTHDPGAAAHADQVVFLADGVIVGQLEQPTASAVIDHMHHISRSEGGLS